MAYNNGLVVGNQGGVNSQVGVREELADYIAIVDAKSTPLLAMAPKGKDIGNLLFSWQVDNFSDPVPGGTADGTDVTLVAGATGKASANRTRLYNYAQVFRRWHRTGFVAETSNVAGISNETAKGVSKRLIELKRDIESTFACINQAAAAEASTPTGALTSSLGTWLLTNVSTGIGAPTTTFETNTSSRSTVTTANFVEATVQNVLTQLYADTGVMKTYDGIVGSTLKRNFTNLTQGKIPVGIDTNAIAASGVRTFNINTEGTYSANISIFEGDFGTIRLHPTTFIGTTNGTAFAPTAYKGYLIPSDMIEVRYSKLPEVKDLPDNGGGPFKLIQAIAGLVVKNPVGFGVFNGAS